MTSRYLNARVCMCFYLIIIIFIFLFTRRNGVFTFRFLYFPRTFHRVICEPTKPPTVFRFTRSPSCVFIPAVLFPCSVGKHTDTFRLARPFSLPIHLTHPQMPRTRVRSATQSPPPLVPMGSSSERVSVFSGHQSRSGRPPGKTLEYRIHVICVSDTHNAICPTDLRKITRTHGKLFKSVVCNRKNYYTFQLVRFRSIALRGFNHRYVNIYMYVPYINIGHFFFFFWKTQKRLIVRIVNVKSYYDLLCHLN